ncbi:MAG: cytochrome c oxidase subunit II [Bacteroidetes bacterium]|nr:cytochrome c oxidase subunit II [Bacteroidota bacterium]
MNPGASNFSQGVDLAFYVIFGISVVLLVLITVTMVYFIIRYNKKRHPVPANIEGSVTLEIIWTVIPVILVLIMFWFGYIGYKPMEQIPDEAIEITAIARMWSWTFEYDNGRKSDRLIVPYNKPVKLDLVSQDVLHNLYIPAFRIKKDVVPGRTNTMWFVAQKEGSYDILCAEYCGLRHAFMITKIDVIPDEEYLAWYELPEDSLKKDNAELWYEVTKANGCIGCHSTDGSKLVGSTFKGLYNSKKLVITAGKEREIVADEEYLKKSITEPNEDVVKGYSLGLMPSYKDQISDEDIDIIVKYIKSLADEQK